MLARGVGGVGVLILGAMGLLVSGCSGDRTGAATDGNETVEMARLAQMNGCFECHRVDATVVGPSWKVIADRYKDAPLAETRALLVERVKKGSVGQYPTWKGGQGMPPMERRVSSEHIVRLVDYILSLRKTPPATVAAPEAEPEAEQ